MQLGQPRKKGPHAQAVSPTAQIVKGEQLCGATFLRAEISGFGERCRGERNPLPQGKRQFPPLLDLSFAVAYTLLLVVEPNLKGRYRRMNQIRNTADNAQDREAQILAAAYRMILSWPDPTDLPDQTEATVRNDIL